MSKQKANSVHLQDFPDVSKINSNYGLIQEMDKVKDICSIALAIRDKKNLRVRLPLNNLKIVGKNIESLKKYKDIIQEEVNVKNIDFNEEIGDLAEFKIQIDFKKLGTKLGKKIQEVSRAARAGDWENLENDKIKLGGEVLEKNEYEIKLSPKDNDSTSVISTNDAIIILDTTITEELTIEGIARDLIRMIQQFRRESGFDVSDRIEIIIKSNYEKLKTAIQKHSSYIKEQTLGTSIILIEEETVGTKHSYTTLLDEEKITIGLSITN